MVVELDKIPNSIRIDMAKYRAIWCHGDIE
jgi:hypothetical protein